MQQPYVVVLAKGINGLGALRSARHAGLRAYAIVDKPRDLSVYSRMSVGIVTLPPDFGLEALRPVLARLASQEGGPGVLIACSDATAELLSDLKETGYSEHHIIAPTSEATRILNDKQLECRVMEDGGVSLPRTYYELDRDEPDTFPIIIKPRTFRDYQTLKAKNLVIYSQEEFERFRSRFKSQLSRFLGQEVIPGTDDNLWVCNATFNQNHELSACFVFNRLGTMPSHYGVTSLAISRDNPELRAWCEKIGQSLRYCGPAMIEFKRDALTGTYYYLETNPRLGMCNWFDTRCGVNNILACVQVALGDPVSFVSQKNNRVYWNFFGDLIARLESREKLFSISVRYLRLLFYHRIGALFYWRDPVPAAKYAMDMIRNITHRVVKRLLSTRIKP